MNDCDTALDTEYVLALYKEHREDLGRVREEMRQLHRARCVPWRYRSLAHKVFARIVQPVMGPVGLNAPMLAQGDDETCEVLYLLLRDSRPEQVVEISPFHGWSTCWILSALRDNGKGSLKSYDLLDASSQNVPASLSAGRWELVVGDVTKRAEQLPEKIDFLLMDSDHSAEFAQWYIDNVFPRVPSGNPTCVDDVFHTADPASFDGEGQVVIDWLQSKKTDWFTCSRPKNPSALNAINGHKASLGFGERIRTNDVNPAIFFRMP